MLTPVRALTVAAAFGAMAAAGTVSANAAVCKQHSHTGSATGAYEGWTAIKARGAWRNDVREHEGVAWTLWSMAKFKTTRCSKAGQKGRWSCVARARPCRTGS